MDPDRPILNACSLITTIKGLQSSPQVLMPGIAPVLLPTRAGFRQDHLLRAALLTDKVSSTAQPGTGNRSSFSGRGLAISSPGHLAWTPTFLLFLRRERWLSC
jgi:hypothetical protein